MLFPHRLSACALLLGTLTMASSVSAEDTFRQHDAHVHGVVEFNIAQDGKELLMEITAPGADIVGFEHAPSNKQQQQALEHAIQQLNNASHLFALSPSAKCQLNEAYVTETLTEQNTHIGHDHEEQDHDSHAGHEHEEHDHDSHVGHEHEEHDHDSHAGHEHEEHDHDSHAGHEHEEHDHDSHAGHEHEEHDHDSHAGHEHEEHDHDSHAGHEHEEHDHDSHAGHEHDSHADRAHGEFSAQYVFHCSDISQLQSLDVYWFKAFPTTEKITIQAITEASQKAVHLTPTNTRFRF